MSVCNETPQVRNRSDRSFMKRSGEQGMAMLTVMMILLLLTVLGIAAITASGLENSMAGLQRTMEASANAAESCLGTGANIIQQVFLPESGSQVPVELLDNNSPPGPVPNGNKTVLENELIGNPENLTDVPTGPSAAPNLRMTVGPYAVAGDIDRLYVKMRGRNRAAAVLRLRGHRCRRRFQRGRRILPHQLRGNPFGHGNGE